MIVDRHYPFLLFISGHIGCHTNVLSILDNSCSGRKSCDFDIYANLDQRDDLTPCPQGLTKYLEASYKCIPGRYCHIFINGMNGVLGLDSAL